MSKLKHITFTGIDAKVDLDVLENLQKRYPIAEFGVLASESWHDLGNRFFNPSYIDSLDYRNFNLSVHLCGNLAREAVRGNIDPFRKWAHGFGYLFKRCQLNISNYKTNPESFKYSGEIVTYFDEVILQQNSVDNCSLYLASENTEHITVLFDSSGGKGIDTPIKILESPRKIGYAGGINSENVGDKLSSIFKNENVNEFWIDMESGIRTNDWFDIEKVVKVLENCESIIKKYDI